MPLSPQILDLFPLAIIAEFQAYGFNVVGQEHVYGLNYYYPADLRQFYEDHTLDQAAAFIWLSESDFAKIVNERQAGGQDMSGSCFTGWLYFAGRPSVNAELGNAVGRAMASRLNNGNAVTLTPATAKYLKATLAAEPPLYCSRIVRLALWLLIHKVLWLNGPLMIALRHNGRRAKLWHLRVALVANLFVPSHLRRT